MKKQTKTDYNYSVNESTNELQIWIGQNELVCTISDAPKCDKKCTSLMFDVLNDLGYKI